MPRAVHRSTTGCAQHELGHRAGELHNSDHREADAQPDRARISGGAWEPLEDARGEIRHRHGGLDAYGAVQRAGLVREGSAAGAGSQVSGEEMLGNPGIFAVEGGRQGRPDARTVHARIVDAGQREVPLYPPRAVDELTRLLQDAQDGDRIAWAGFVRAAQVDVWRLASRMVGSEDADDVTQDVFVRAWRALPAFRGEASGRTWLLAIARRACADAVRARVRRRRVAQLLHRRADAASRHGSDLVEDEASTLAVWDLVERLGPGRREAFVLTQLLGCSYAETAEICGVAVGTIRSRVARAREDLLAALRAAEAS